jgi:hypothetical protein
VHCGAHWHWPEVLQVVPEPQLPHEPLQPSEPHCLPLHDGVQLETH